MLILRAAYFACVEIHQVASYSSLSLDCRCINIGAHKMNLQ